MNGSDKPVAEEDDDENDGNGKDEDQQEVECMNILFLNCFHSAQKNKLRL